MQLRKVIQVTDSNGVWHKHIIQPTDVMNTKIEAGWFILSKDGELVAAYFQPASVELTIVGAAE